MRHRPARVASVLTVGASVSGMFAIVAVLARSGETPGIDAAEQRVEVRIGHDVSESEARAAVRAWLDGQPALGTRAALTVVDAPADTTSSPS